MKTFQATAFIKCLFVALVLVSIGHLLWDSIQVFRSVPQHERTENILQLTELRKGFNLPSHLGLVLHDEDSSKPAPEYLMTAQYALSPSLVSLNAHTDTLLLYTSGSRSEISGYRMLWLSGNSKWALLVRDASY